MKNEYRNGRLATRELLATLGWDYTSSASETGILRYRLPDTDWHLTLGTRTATLYRENSASDEPFAIESYPLNAPEALAERLTTLDAERLAAFAEIEEAEQVARDRELLGRLVREVWVAYCVEIGDTKPSHLAPWDELTEDEREVDRRIGERLFDEGVAALARAKLGLNVTVENDFGPSRPIYISYSSTTPAPLDTNE